MKLAGVVSASLVALGMVLSQGLQAADSKQAAPKDNKGFKASKTTVVDLGPEIEGMQGHQLRLRLLAIEPGGHIAVHSHKNRPAVVYFLKGVDTVIAEDGSSKQFRPGETSTATKNTTHWHRNDGKELVELIAVDIFQPPAK